MDGFRIVTINTGKGDGLYRSRMRLLVDQLAEFSPDLVACQEAFASKDAHADTARLLAGELGMNLAYSPARRKRRFFGERYVDSESGMALLSRKRWVAFEALTLPCDPRDGERVAQIGVLDLGRVRLVVANVHLTHLRDGDPLRVRQLDTVLRHPLFRHGGSVRLICGDFNTTAEGAVLRPILGQPTGVRDTWELGGGFGPRGTLAGPGPSGPCVDYILSVDGPPDVMFEGTTIALDRHHPEHGILPSDHLGIATTLLLGRNGSAK